MTDRTLYDEDGRRARAEAAESAARGAQAAEVAALLETATAMVRRLRDGSVVLHRGSRPGHFVFDRRDVGALRAVLALLERGR